MNEYTFAMIKPDAVARGLTGEIIKRIECKRIQIMRLELLWLSDSQISELYLEHKDKFFFADLLIFTGKSRSVIMQLYGFESISIWRQLMGSTKSNTASPGTIRGDFGSGDPIWENLVHGSDSKESALRELGIFWPEELERTQ